MNHGSLFSGGGGFDLAAEWMGWNNIFHCEIADFPKQILAYYWPNAKSYTNVKETDFSSYKGKIDILTGGFPCQPFSNAGNQKGTGDERYLWPEMLRAIREIQPRWVVGENVRGLVSWSKGMVFEQVCADLEAEGYEVFPALLPACGVNAPHRRERIWFIAFNSNTKGHRHRERQGIKVETASESSKIRKLERGSKRFRIQRATANTSRKRPGKLQNKGKTSRASKSSQLPRRIYRISYAADTNIPRQQKFNLTTKSNKQGFRARPYFKKLPNWKKFPTQSPVRCGDDGLSYKLDGITFPKWRNESIKLYGNAVVPQVVLQIFKSIQQYEKLNLKPSKND